MSHQKFRKETDCLNCGTELKGNYCHICGQANIETSMSFWQLVTHFVSDLFHYDGKFFQAIRYLFTRPGFLSKMWHQGKRVGYLDPVKMYIFFSAFYFFTIAFVYKPGLKESKNDNRSKDEMVQPLIKDSLTNISDEILADSADSASNVNSSFTFSDRGTTIIKGIRYRNIDQYLTRQDSLPADMKDSRLEQWMYKRVFELSKEFNDNPEGFMRYLIQKIFGSLPYMMFILLPFLAGILKLLYIRHKQFYYSDHAIFTIHIVLFLFMVNLVNILLAKTGTLLSGWKGIFSLLSTCVTFFAIGNIFMAFRNFYQQGWVMTFLKNSLFYFLSFIVMLLAALIGFLIVLMIIA